MENNKQLERYPNYETDLPETVFHGGISVTFVQPNSLRQRLEHTDEMIPLLQQDEADLPEPCTEASIWYRNNKSEDTHDVQLVANIVFDAPDEAVDQRMWQSLLRSYLDKELKRSGVETAKLAHHQSTLYAQLDDTYAAQISLTEDTSSYNVDIRLERISAIMESQVIHDHDITPDYFESHTNQHDVSDTPPYELVYKFTQQWVTTLASIKKVFGSAQSASGISTFVINAPERIDSRIGHPNETIEQETDSSDRISMTFDDIGGVFYAKEQLQRKALTFKHPELAQTYGLQNSGFILHGPAGTGKTSLVEAFANDIGAELREFSSTDIVTKWVGKSGQKAAEIFEAAKTVSHPLVLFFDEIDSLAPKGDSGTTERRDVKNVFKRELTALAKHNPNIIVAAATNEDPDNFDEALLRAGRLEAIYVAAPDEKERAEIWHIKLAQLASSLPEATLGSREDDIAYHYGANPNTLAAYGDMLTGADIDQVLQRVKVQKFLEAVNSGVPTPITESDILREIRAYSKP